MFILDVCGVVVGLEFVVVQAGRSNEADKQRGRLQPLRERWRHTMVVISSKSTSQRERACLGVLSRCLWVVGGGCCASRPA